MGFTREDLKELDSLWKESESLPEPGRPLDLPEGDYQLRIDSASVDKTDAGKAYLRWKFTVVGGNDKLVGQQSSKLDGLSTAQNMAYLRATFKKIGVEPPRGAHELEAALNDSAGRVVEAEVKRKGEYTNVYFNSLVSAPGKRAAAAPPKAEEKAQPPKGRTLPTQDAIAKMSSGEARAALEAHFELESPPKKPRTALKILAAAAEGDQPDGSVSLGDLNMVLAALGDTGESTTDGARRKVEELLK